MANSAETKPKDITSMVLEETKKRQDTYYDVARPGEPGSAIPAMTWKSHAVVVGLGVVLLIIWLIGRFVLLPIYT